MCSRVSLQLSIDSIFLELQKAVHPSQPLPAHVKEWASWLSSKRLAIIFCQYPNASRWGWVSEEDSVSGTPDYDFSILLDLAKLTDATRIDHKLPVEYFRFCYALTVLQQTTHLLTTYAFPHKTTPIYEGPEAGEGFEMELLGGRLVCAWDSGHVSEFRHLRDLYLVRSSGEFYRLGEYTSASIIFKISLGPRSVKTRTILTASFEKSNPRPQTPSSR
ncbi:hypothetical protein C8R47DRAFT_1135284 [Mycena vitilis]|nr:hypothetical protein C8R47DRAFT_1135284 [Mycena vitilis]